MSEDPRVREFMLPEAELAADGVILSTFSAGLLRDGKIAATFSLGMGGFEYVCTASSVKGKRTLRVWARKLVPLPKWNNPDVTPMRAPEFFAREDEHTVETGEFVRDLAGLIVEWGEGRCAVLGQEIIIVPSASMKSVAAGTIARPGEPSKPQPEPVKPPPCERGMLF